MSSYTLNERVYTIADSLSHDLQFETALPYVFDLAHLGALDISGATAETFLQGQLTCDVTEVNPTQMRPGAMCSLQGRLLSLLDVVAWQGLHLVMPQDMLALCQKSLAKTALFSRVNLSINPHWQFLGLYLPEHAVKPNLPLVLPAAPWQICQNEHGCAYALSERLWIIILPHSDLKNTYLSQFSEPQIRGSLAWHYLEMQIPRLSIYPNTRELFLPHRLQLHTTPYISFNKGCYKGQEIIARTHYRAKLKHELKLFQITTDEPMFAGQKCYASPQETELGEIVDYCPLDSRQYLLAMSMLLAHPKEVFFEQHARSVML